MGVQLFIFVTQYIKLLTTVKQHNHYTLTRFRLYTWRTFTGVKLN